MTHTFTVTSQGLSTNTLDNAAGLPLPPLPPPPLLLFLQSSGSSAAAWPTQGAPSPADGGSRAPLPGGAEELRSCRQTDRQTAAMMSGLSVCLSVCLFTSSLLRTGAPVCLSAGPRFRKPNPARLGSARFGPPSSLPPCPGVSRVSEGVARPEPLPPAAAIKLHQVTSASDVSEFSSGDSLDSDQVTTQPADYNLLHQVWSDGTWSNDPPPPSLWKPRVCWIRVNNEADWSTNRKAPPTRRYPQASYWLPTSFAKKNNSNKNRASPSPSVAASGRRGCFPHWSVCEHANCQSFSSGQSGYSTCGTFWNFEKREKKEDDEEGDQPIR
ncbi:unnamed protein product [Pleuronectes platessa]|uniref:Uncharacterized protein n=1 Tax=Pleuronectes platessa TaxID=8262 RepID=A0A9N7YCW4_PLEPL|nr:unnamed protein product [Pleuronectes platessa]